MYGIRFVPPSLTGALQETGKKAKELGMHRVMVCTEKALCDFKVATQVIDVLKEEELEVFVLTNAGRRPQ